jgi:hypothetical protein
MRAIACGILAASFGLAAPGVSAADFSILGVRLGMGDAAILSALPDDLRRTASRELVGLYGEVDEPFVRIDAGDGRCAVPGIVESGGPCIRLRAFLHQRGSRFEAAVVVLEQRFDPPMDPQAVMRALEDAYGGPTIRLARTRAELDPASGRLLSPPEETPVWPDGLPIRAAPFMPRPFWLWSADVDRLAAADRLRLLTDIPNLGEIDLHEPVLRAAFRTDGEGRVVGLTLVLADPVSSSARARSAAAAVAERQRRELDDARSRIRLRD